MTSSPESPDPWENTSLLGQSDPAQTLEQALASGRLHHGWLFHGRRGIGKATLAYRFARVLLAGGASGPGLELRQDHPAFTQIAGRHHPDLFVIEAERDPKTGKVKPLIPVDRVRDVTTKLHSTAAIAERRVLIVDGAEQLNRNAANALLKPLEEPPPGVVLILITHRPGLVAATLRSRCAKLACSCLDEVTLASLLEQYAPDLPMEARSPIIAMAKGSIGRALELASGQWLDTYKTILTTLAADPPDPLAIDELALTLAKISTKEGFSAVTDLIQTVFSRIVAHTADRFGTPFFVDEHVSIARLAARQGLDRWGGLWEKIGRMSAAVDSINLDHAQSIAQILSAMADPPEVALPFVRPASSLGDDLLGCRPF